MRKPIVSGSFYAADEDSLRAQIKQCFLHKFGPGKLPAKKSGSVKAVICPHAGYAYSGPCAAHSYKAVAEAQKPDLFLLLGLSHSGHGNCVSLENWKTPLGTAKVDRDFGKILAKNGIKQDEIAHEQEHSIEVQLPFLQYLLDDFRFLPVIVSNYENAASAIKKSIEQSGKKVFFIASSDFTHYGANYGYAPFIKNIKENMYLLDNGAIDLIKKTDSVGFVDYVDRTGATICGAMPIAALLSCINGAKAELLKYYTSADISGGDYSLAVGYAAIRFS